MNPEKANGSDQGQRGFLVTSCTQTFYNEFQETEIIIAIQTTRVFKAPKFSC